LWPERRSNNPKPVEKERQLGLLIKKEVKFFVLKTIVGQSPETQDYFEEAFWVIGEQLCCNFCGVESLLSLLISEILL
jgi:hypothetical protein